MHPFRKQFDAQPSFPFSIAYKDTKTATVELPDHLHDWYELVYVYSGKGTFLIGRTLYDMRAGDLFAIPGNTVHRAIPDKDDPVTSTAVFFSSALIFSQPLGDVFSYLQYFEHCRSSNNFKLSCSADMQRFITMYLETIQTEIHAASIGYRHAILLCMHQILLLLNREKYGAHKTDAGTTALGPEWLKDILLYIDAHYTEDIGLDKLSALASVSSAHFCRQFRQWTGMTVMDYVTIKRIMKAKKQLLASKDKVNVIACNCGYESLPHFHRMFKKMTGVTPAAYRRGTGFENE